MTNKDEIVARAIEDKPFAFNLTDEVLSTGKAWQIQLYMDRDGWESEWIARSFISAPTPDTEWIVLQWVQEQDDEFQKTWMFALIDIINARGFDHQSKYIPLSYKVEDWAKALYEVLDG